MNYVDLHCDTLYEMLLKNNEISLDKNKLSVDIEKLKKGNSLAQIFAVFINQKETNDPLQTALEMIDKFYLELDKFKEHINLALNYDDILKNKDNNKISAMLSIEEGAALKGKLSNLRIFHKLGVRLITLSWNYPNEIGYPNINILNSKDYINCGLSNFGKNLIEEMNKLNIIVDVSHLSDGGFYDVAAISKKPFIASHSNCREVTNHRRNLTDDMIKVLSNKGGLTGINFAHNFLGGSKRGTVEEMVNHIKHLKKIGGIEVIAIGSDLDGISVRSEIESSAEIYKLIEALKANNFTEEEIDKIMYKNALRVFKDTL